MYEQNIFYRGQQNQSSSKGYTHASPTIPGHLKNVKKISVHAWQKLTFKDLCEKVCIIFIVEWRISTEKNVRDDANTPNVDALSVRLLGKNFRGDVAWKKNKESHSIIIVKDSKAGYSP